MAGGHDQLWKDLIQAFPADFVRLAGPDLAARLLGAIEFEPAEAHSGAPRGKERRLDLIASRAIRAARMGLRCARPAAGPGPARIKAEVSLENRGSTRA